MKTFFKQPKSTNSIPKGNYIVQPKYDGERMQYIDKGSKGLLLLNRRYEVKNKQYPEFNSLAKHYKGKNIIDGELVVYNKQGRDDFSLLSKRSHLKYNIPQAAKQYPAKLVAFDVLQFNNNDVRNKPWSERNKLLQQFKLPNVQVIKSYPVSNATQLMKGREGVVFKKTDSIYDKATNDNWLKLKNEKSADLLVTGYIEGRGKRKGMVGAVNVAYKKEGALINVGKVGSFKGMNEQQLKLLKQRLDAKQKTFVKVSYLEKGAQGRLRMPKVIGMRTDITEDQTHVDRCSKDYIYLQPTKKFVDVITKKNIPEKYLHEVHEDQIAYTSPLDPNNIFIGGGLKKVNFNKDENINTISKIIGHEELHNVIRKEQNDKITHKLDKITVPLIRSESNDEEILNPNTYSNLSFKQKRIMDKIPYDKYVEAYDKEFIDNNIDKNRYVYKKGKYHQTQHGPIVIKMANDIKTKLQPYTSRIMISGSIRRGVKSPTDIDLITIPKDKEKIKQQLINMGGKKILEGEQKVAYRVNGVKVEVNFTDDKSWGARLMESTGPWQSNIGQRIVARKQGFLLNNTGLYKRNDGYVAGRTEEDIYHKLGKQYKQPELRGR